MRPLPNPLLRLLACLLLLALLAGVALHPPSNLDVDWYLLAARTWDAGGSLYVTLRDPNTPAVWYLFLGVHRLAEALGLPAHRVFYVLVALATLALLAFAAWLLPRQRWTLLLGGGFLAGYCALMLAGQRDPLALLLLLPYLAWTQRLAEQPAARPLPGYAASLLAGAAILIKPHFLLWLLAGEALLAWRRRSWRAWLRRDLLLPGMAMAGLGGGLLLLHPAYLDYLATWAPYYAAFPAAPLSARALFGLGLLGLLLLARLLLARLLLAPAPVGRSAVGWGDVMLAAALAALATALIQDKWWDYQAVPIETFAGLGWLALLPALPRLAAALPPWRRRLLAALALAALAWFAGAAVSATRQQARFVWSDFRQPGPEELAAALRRLAPEAPVALLGGPGLIGAYLSGNLWALADPGYWVVDLAQAEVVAGRPLAPVLAAAAARHRDEVLARLAEAPPALLGIHRGGTAPGAVDALPFYLADPRFAALLERWRPAGQAGGYDLWRPR